MTRLARSHELGTSCTSAVLQILGVSFAEFHLAGIHAASKRSNKPTEKLQVKRYEWAVVKQRNGTSNFLPVLLDRSGRKQFNYLNNLIIL